MHFDESVAGVPGKECQWDAAAVMAKIGAEFGRCLAPFDTSAMAQVVEIQGLLCAELAAI